MDYTEYAYLQSGRVTDAQTVLTNMNALSPVGGLTLTGDYALAAVPARYTIELGKWEDASNLVVRENAVPWAQAITWTAVGVGAARGEMPIALRKPNSLRETARPKPPRSTTTTGLNRSRCRSARSMPDGSAEWRRRESCQLP